jgi:uncharacterized membrane-anchored protein YhcB (DUF1043 family)
MVEQLANEIGQIAQWGAVGICIFVTVVLAYIIKRIQDSNTEQQKINAVVVEKYRELFADQFKQMAICLQANAEVIRGMTDVVSNDIKATEANTSVLQGLKEQLLKCNS